MLLTVIYLKWMLPEALVFLRGSAKSKVVM
jgi:hypothetical protein